MDRATALGILGLVILLGWTMISGAGWSAGVFWQTPSVALVIGGSVLATIASYPGNCVRELGRVLRVALQPKRRSPVDSVITLVALATIARREGLLALDKRVDRIDDAFLQKAMRMAIDGSDPSAIRRMMESELQSTDLRHTYGKGLYETMGRFSPVFGMIGTVIGLVIMLGRMEDPSQIGPGMAVALLTTMYGLIFAHVFCLPIARKLGHHNSEELLQKTLVLEGVLAVQRGEHPRILERLLESYLPPGAVGTDVASAAARMTAERKPADGNKGDLKRKRSTRQPAPKALDEAA